jgi:hypothetical protein
MQIKHYKLLLYIFLTLVNVELYANIPKKDNINFDLVKKNINNIPEIKFIDISINADSIVKEHPTNRVWQFENMKTDTIIRHKTFLTKEYRYADSTTIYYSLKIINYNSKSIGVNFDSLFLPENHKLLISDINGSSIDCPSKNRRFWKKFYSFPINTDTLIIEYSLPIFDSLRLGHIEIESFYLDFLSVEENSPPNLHTAKSEQVLYNLVGWLQCVINEAHCYNGACKEKKSVCKINIGDNSIASGVLINNTRNDGKPYVLTAFHCIDTDENGTLSTTEINAINNWRFKFGYIRDGCQDPFVYDGYTYDGAEFRAAWYNTDFALVEMDEMPQSGDFFSGYGGDVYYAGWDARNITPGSSIAFHYPMTTFPLMYLHDPQPPIQSSVLQNPCSNMYPGIDYWRINTANNGGSGTNWKASSGSPLFNPSSNRVIGQLWGGCGACTNNRPQIYGALWRSWTGGGTNETRLSNWLDPDASGVQVLDGYHPDTHYGGANIEGNGWTNAIRNLSLGSIDKGVWVNSFTVDPSATHTFKAGREIRLLPCTHLKHGSNVRLHIQEVTCNDDLRYSFKESDMRTNCGVGWIYKSNENSSVQENELTQDFFSKESITAYPSPTNETINITCNIIKSNIIGSELYITSALGNRIDISTPQNTQYSINYDCSHLAAGIYYVVLKTATGVLSTPFIIIR